ncbi:related to Rpc19 - DNA-directed RNA polymerases I and III, 18KD subunit [Moesziomyces antarcticus]|uniref:DNA-directed RNA polymerases I and III subunit RPAC2 n=1 Tax=Pseudozyma antarctica TaxID=84753 RepID=A0A5C3FIS2_PSEA2|nr:related to Rpc19 - DNA-directed RNA polymerases I and III, 18KD subunit [Moesziomyces antarcticus]
MSNPNLAEVMGDGPASIADKLTLLPGYEPDFSAVTFCLKEEDHTLGNSLRYMIMKDPRVEFCGYSNPHPSENKIHLRVQMYDRASALDALRDAIENLDQLFAAIGEAYEKNLSAGNYEKHVEPKIDHDALAILAEEGKKRRAEEQAKLAESRAQAAAAAAGRPM